MIAQTHKMTYILKGRLYFEEFDVVKYLKGHVVLSFKLFDREGNPQQHISSFRASYNNVRNNNTLLYRLFITSLKGMKFNWYAKISNGSIKTFVYLDHLFI